jgi:hypothetical protein
MGQSLAMTLWPWRGQAPDPGGGGSRHLSRLLCQPRK